VEGRVDSSAVNRLRLQRFFSDDDYSPPERESLQRLIELLAELPQPPDPLGLFGRYDEYRDRLLRATEGNDAEVLEEAFLTLYAHLHGHEAPYTATERARVRRTGGYWCHAGGLSPILKAGAFLTETSVSADFGAGNGLQGLLMQVLYPHQRTIQIEISSRMVAAGKELQGWLGVPEEKVEWIVGDVLDASPEGIDFIYLYRPVRPEGEGRRFYESLAATLESGATPVVIFSIADCLREFLGKRFEIFYSDGHLTCFRTRG
jgi:hypothetical protein